MKKFAVLANNYVERDNLKACNGLSVFIRYQSRDILFDTGPDSTFLENASFMNISLENLSGVVVSHKHLDHTRGLKYLDTKAPVYVPSDFNMELEKALDISTVTDSVTVDENIHVFRPEAGECEELFLMVENTLFSGCFHSSVPEVLKKAKLINPHVDTIVGGLHTAAMTDNDIHRRAAEISSAGIKKVIALHCSGVKIIHLLEQLGISAVFGAVGYSFDV